MHTPQKNLQALRDLLDTVNNNTRDNDTNLTDAMGNLTDDVNNQYTRSLHEFGFETSVEGEHISITDSMEMPPLNAYVYGKSTQFTTGGNQLLRYPYYDTTRTSNGLTLTDKGNGVVHISGTATATTYFAFYANEEGKRLPLEAGTYTLSRNTSTNDISINGREKLSDGTNGSDVYMSNAKSSKTFTIQEGSSIFLSVAIKEGVTCDEDVYLMLNKGSTALPWEPYTGGIAAPNPDYPQEISSCGEYFERGKNQLFNPFDMGRGVLATSPNTHNGVTVTKQPDGTLLLNGTCTTDFDIYLCSNKGSNGNAKLLTHINENYGVYTLSTNLGLNCSWYNGTTYVRMNFTSSETNQLVAAIVSIPKYATYNNTVLQIMINEGSTALPWEPYTGEDSAAINGYVINYAVTEKNLCPKNLLKKGWYGDRDVLGKPTTNAGYPNSVYGIPFKIKKGTTISWNFGSTKGVSVRLRMLDVNGVVKTYLNLPDATSGTTTVGNDYFYIIPLFLHGVPDECIITYSDTVPTEDKLQPLTIQTPNGLRGIKVGKAEDANYTDSEGNMWACDYIKLAEGKYVQRIVEATIDGSEVYGWNNGGTWHMGKRFFAQELLSPQAQGIGAYAMSDMFVIQNDNYVCNRSSVRNNQKSMYYNADGSTFAVNANVLFETQDAAGFKKFFSEHPTKIYAILKTPIETYLPYETLAQIASLTMNHPNTTILNDANAYSKIAYVADPNLYIKNLTNSILTLGGGV